MTFSKKMILGIALASLFFAPACKKNDSANTGTAAHAIEEENWVVADVNGLLPYVPENTPMILASTRELDMGNPLLKTTTDAFFKSVITSGDQLIAQLDELKKKNPNFRSSSIESMEVLTHAYTQFKPILENYAQGAPLLGLNEHGHIDFVAYIDGIQPVVKLTLKDSKKFETQVISIWEKAKSTYSDKNALPQIQERKIGEETFRIISIKPYLDMLKGVCIFCDENKKSYLPSNLVIHVGKKVLTLALLDENIDDNALKKCVTQAEKPIKKEAFGKIDSDMLFVGYVNNQAVYRTLASDKLKPVLKNFMGSELTQECDQEFTEMISKFPKFEFNTRISKDHGLNNNAVLHMTDKELLKKIQALNVNTVDLKSTNSKLSASLNIDVDAMVSLLNSSYASMMEKNYTCKIMQKLPRTIKEATKTISNPQIKMFTSGITGININIDKLDVKSKPVNVEGVIALSGTKFGTTIPLAITMASALSPDLREMSLEKNITKSIDLSPVLKQSIKLNAIYTDNALIFATDAYDVKSIAETPQIKSNAFLTISGHDRDGNGYIGNNKGINIQTLPGSSFTVKLGTNEDGITYFDQTLIPYHSEK